MKTRTTDFLTVKESIEVEELAKASERFIRDVLEEEKVPVHLADKFPIDCPECDREIGVAGSPWIVEALFRHWRSCQARILRMIEKSIEIHEGREE